MKTLKTLKTLDGTSLVQVRGGDMTPLTYSTPISYRLQPPGGQIVGPTGDPIGPGGGG